ncbi:MAG TPA: protein kinase [Candidatus Acidoferrales bacterium]|nr:protein kinase [Candidatus Acidoferrales bacterium]
MTPERFQQVEELYHAARAGTAEERAALLAQTDPELRREIESLLAQGPGGEFLDRPAIQNAPDLPPDLPKDSTGANLAAGACLGPYRIESKLGEGGMGEVFRAVDRRLGRAVAVKVTQQQFSARFAGEARAIASLNHPNICTVYDVGPNYLVMELVEGETLAARLKQGPLSIEMVRLYGAQIAAALVEAHAKGIVHRDLKPGNIMIAKSGVKVLDFGLAKSGQDETVTASGMVMGTPAYMAPEQREGKPADARSDIYSLGCVLYEMLTAARVVSQRRRLPSRKLEKIVNQCLEEDPGRRWQSAAELERELGKAGATGPWKPVAAAFVILAVFAAVYAYLHRAPKLTGKDTVVLADFENKTGDPVFDQTLRQGLAVQLEQSPFLTLVSEQRIQQVLRLMNRPAETRLTPEFAREVCERTASAAVLEGSIAKLGNQYVLWLRARNCRTGDIFGEEQVQAGRKEEVLDALTRVAIQIRTRLGESLATIQEHSTPLEEATTTSLEALKAYSAGRSAMFAHGFAAGIPHLQRAIAIDPQFAMALGDLSFMYSNMGQTDLAAEYTREAYQFRDRVSDRERLWILFLYDRQVTGNLQRELQTLDLWTQTYPRDETAFSVIGGWGTQGTGQYEKGIQAAQVALRLNPDDPFAYVLAAHYTFLNRFPEAAEALQRAADRKLEIPEYLVTRYYLAFFKSDQAVMEREIARARGVRGLEDWMSHNQALVLARSGRMLQARTMWERAIALAEQAGERERVAIYETAEAVCEAHFGNMAAAKSRAEAALQLAKGRDVEYGAAFALALAAGDSSESQKLASDLEKRFPEDTPVQFEYIPTLRALFALAHQAPLDAVERLQTALPYDFALPGTAFFAHFGGVYPAYVRGEGYLAAGRGREAAAEFQKVLDHRGIVFADPIGALALVQLGRAYHRLREEDKAKASYQDFLSLWKDADRDIPILQKAKAEYARLQ